MIIDVDTLSISVNGVPLTGVTSATYSTNEIFCRICKNEINCGQTRVTCALGNAHKDCRNAVRAIDRKA